MKVAIVNDWLMKSAGAEKVFEQVLTCFPQADIFSLLNFLPPADQEMLQGKSVKTSFLQWLPFAKTKYRNLLFLMPRAIEAFDFTGYDLIISLPHAVAKGIRTSSEQLHIAYLQARNLKYIYDDRDFYRGHRLKDKLIDWMIPSIQKWDQKAAKRPNHTIANSKFVQAWHYHRYQVPSEVIYPPVDSTFFQKFYQEDKKGYYVTVGRLEPYKNTELIVRAFNQNGLPLKVVGDGTQLKKLLEIAKPNIEFLGFCSKEQVATAISQAKAFIFASREDFGIAPIEAQACGTPVIALAEGGALETIRNMEHENPTGVFFDQPTVEGLLEGIQLFISQYSKIKALSCRENARRFDVTRFRQEFTQRVESYWEEFKSRQGGN